MPGGVPIVAMNKRGDIMPMMASDMVEGMMEEDDGLGLADEDPDDATGVDTFGLNDTKPVVMDDLELHEEVSAAAKKSSDAVEDQADEDVMEGSAGLPLGEWVNLPRGSRRIAGLSPINLLDNPNDVEGMRMLHVATNDTIRNFSKFDNESGGMLKDRNETRYLENFALWCLLNQMPAKTGASKNEEKSVLTLLKEFTQLHDKDAFETKDLRKLLCRQRQKVRCLSH